MGRWEIEDRDTVEVDEPVRTVRVELVSGTVDVVSTDGPTRVEAEVLVGPPVVVTLEDGELRVRYAKPTWFGVPRWVKSARREVRVSVAVAADVEVHLGVVDAEATVAGFTAPARVDTVSGPVTLDDLAGGVRGSTVSGELQLRDVRGAVELDSVSGDLTVVAGHPASLRADTVSGAVTLDLRPGPRATVKVSSVSGDLLLRAPVEALGVVAFSSTGGRIDSANFPVEIHRSPGASEARSHGPGDVDVEGSTVSGRIVLVDQPVA